MDAAIESGLIDAVTLLDSAPVLKAYEEKAKLDAGSYEMNCHRIKNREFSTLMEQVKICGERGILDKKFSYTMKDVQDMITWYHGALCTLAVIHFYSHV